ncbi:MAG: CoA transferase, partial [Acidobacteriaceae bacterium]
RNRETLIPLLEQLFLQADIAHWTSMLEEAGVPCGPINSIDQLLADPQVQAREMVVEVPHPSAGSIKMIASPLKIPTTSVQVRLPPPLLGEHTEQILHELLGYDQQTITSLYTDQVV